MKIDYKFDEVFNYSFTLFDGGISQSQSYFYRGTFIMMPLIEVMRWDMLHQVKRGAN